MLFIAAQLSIKSQPMNQTVDIGDNATFTCNVSEAVPPIATDYRWLFNDTILMDDPGHISGVNTITLTITNVTINDGGSYTFQANDSDSDVTCDVALLFSKCII